MGDTENGAKAKAPAKGTNKKAWAGVVAKVKRELQESKARKQQESPTDRSARRAANATVVLAWVTAITLIAACVTGYFIFQQYKAMEEANEATGFAANKARYDARSSDIATAKQLAILQEQLTEQRQALEVDQRPWLKFAVEGTVTPGTDPNGTARTFAPFVKDQPLKIPVRVTNIGKTVAEQTRGMLFIQVVMNGRHPIIPKRQFQFSALGDPPLKGKTYPVSGWGEATVYPNSVSEASISRVKRDAKGNNIDDPVTQAELDGLSKGTAYIYMIGEVWYSDIFGVRHWTKFCESSNRWETPDVLKCRRFGAVDNNRAK